MMICWLCTVNLKYTEFREDSLIFSIDADSSGRETADTSERFTFTEFIMVDEMCCQVSVAIISLW